MVQEMMYSIYDLCMRGEPKLDRKNVTERDIPAVGDRGLVWIVLLYSRIDCLCLGVGLLLFPFFFMI